MNAEAIVDSQNCRLTLYVVALIIIQTECLYCLKPGVSAIDIYVFWRRNDKRCLYISSKKEKLSSQ